MAHERADMQPDITGGGVDYVVEPNGKPKMSSLAFDVLIIQGTVALLTSMSRADSLKETKTLDIIQGDAIPQRFVPKLISLHGEGEFPFDRLVIYYDFSEINEAITDVDERECDQACVANQRSVK